jgi:hypothetical protein
MFPYHTFPVTANTVESLDFGLTGSLLQCGTAFTIQSHRSLGKSLIPSGNFRQVVRSAQSSAAQKCRILAKSGQALQKSNKPATASKKQNASIHDGEVSCPSDMKMLLFYASGTMILHMHGETSASLLFFDIFCFAWARMKKSQDKKIHHAIGNLVPSGLSGNALGIVPVKDLHTSTQVTRTLFWLSRK